MIRLHINRIVFVASLPSHALREPGIRSGVQAELERLLADGQRAGIRFSAADRRAVRGDKLAPAEPHDSVSVGRAIGSSIFGGVTRVGAP